MREKLIELLYEVHKKPLGTQLWERLGTIADFLIANGVTIPIRCKDCKHYKLRKPYPSYKGNTYSCCRCANTKVSEDDFCSYGEKREV